MWKVNPEKIAEVLELEFHPKCVNEIILTKSRY